MKQFHCMSKTFTLVTKRWRSGGKALQKMIFTWPCNTDARSIYEDWASYEMGLLGPLSVLSGWCGTEAVLISCCCPILLLCPHTHAYMHTHVHSLTQDGVQYSQVRSHVCGGTCFFCSWVFASTMGLALLHHCMIEWHFLYHVWNFINLLNFHKCRSLLMPLTKISSCFCFLVCNNNKSIIHVVLIL